jgi:FkbM family methyltransferase
MAKLPRARQETLASGRREAMMRRFRVLLGLMYEHPGVRQMPLRFLARLLVWRVHVFLGFAAEVHLPGGVTLWCPPEARGQSMMIYTLREKYDPELSRMADWVHEGDVVVDVGAHYGSYATALARLVGSSGRVIAVEPSHHAVETLIRNITLNSLDNVEVLEVAAGDVTQMSDLYVHADPSRSSLIPQAARSIESVPTVRLDDVLRGRIVRFIKIDVEGFEAAVLAGAEEVIAQSSPVILFEYSPELASAAGRRSSEVFELLGQRGYSFLQVTGRSRRRQEVVRAVRPGNVLAVPG